MNAMKLPHHDTVTAFEQPSVWNWLVVFVCGFLTACIISPVVFFILWLLGKGAVVVHVPVPAALLDVPLSSAVRIILMLATVFGVLLATVMVMELSRNRRKDARTQGHHPVIGDFEYSPYLQTWHANPVLPTGKSVRLSAYGSGPSTVQAALWQRYIADFDELNATATRSLLTEPQPLQGCIAVTFTPSGITLTRDGEIHMGFEFATLPEDFWKSEEEEPYPTASFTAALELKSTEWLPPYG